MLVDTVEVTFRAGKGGNGIVSWRREKYVPKGGPDGGDGGRGGSLYLVASNNVDTLSTFRYRKVFQAPDGESGRSKKMHGKAAEDLELYVPVGTIVTNLETGRQIADLVEPNQKALIARGGKGGLGNPHFATAEHQRPEERTLGLPGEVKQVRLELRLIADVALIGEPNAGKSSIISALTGVESRIGAYAFSTTEPILGVMNAGAERITLVDLPGLLEGAHKGKGLGDKFLRHAQRVKALVHVIDGTAPKTDQSEKVILKEIEQFDPELAARPRLLAINKIDLLNKEELKDLQQRFPHAVFLSAEQKTNIEDLRSRIIELIS